MSLFIQAFKTSLTKYAKLRVLIRQEIETLHTNELTVT